MNEKSQAMDFWINQAHENPDARALADAVGLTFPRGQRTGIRSGLKYPIRRLVLTGKDTPENFRLLLGVDSVPDIHAEARQEALIMPIAEESALGLLNKYLDEDCPNVDPRPFTADEENDLRREVAAIMLKGSGNQDDGARA